MTSASATIFYTRQGHQIIPAAGAVIRPRRGVFALAVTNGLALFVEQKHTNGVLELPGGGIETGETHDQAIEREWGEETGIPFAVKDPKAEYNHIRGFYAEDHDEFWIYDQTFRLYDYSSTAKPDEIWINPEGDRAMWKSLADVEKHKINQAHRLGMNALLAQSKSKGLDHR